MLLSWLLASALLSAPLVGADGRAIVGVVRSDHPGLTNPAPPDSPLTYAQIEELVRTAVQEAGGLEGVVEPDHRWIVIKPNIVEPKPSGSGVITDCRVVKAVVELVHEMAPEAKVTIAEGPGGWVSPGHEVRVRAAEVVDGFEVAGYRDLLEDPELRGVDLEIFDLNFDESELLVPKGGGHALDAYWIPKTVLRCDAFINVPVLKVHRGPGITVAMKNMVGIAPGNKYGWAKTNGYPPGRGQGLPHMPAILDEMIVDLASLSRVDFNVVDGIVGMEREKSTDLGGVPVRMNIIVAGRDMVAVDAVCARLMGFNPDDIETITWAAKLGLGVGDLDSIKVRGDPLEKVARRFEKTPKVDRSWWEYGHYGQSVRTWLLKGPFPTEDFGKEFLDPENPGAVPGRNGWSGPVYFHDDKLDLRGYFGRKKNCVAYAYTEFTMPRSQEVELWVGSGEDLRVWIDGEEVYSFRGVRRHRLPNDRERVFIREGKHSLLVKVPQRYGRWDFSLNVCEVEEDPRYDGNRVFGLKFHVPKGPEKLAEQEVGVGKRRFEIDVWTDRKGRAFPFRGKVEVYTVADGLLQDDVRALALGPDGSLWAAGRKGLSRFEGERWESFPVGEKVPWGQVRDLAVGTSGGVWCATDRGMVRFKDGSWEGFPLRWTNGVAVGPDGALWAVGWGGIKRLSGGAWTTCEEEDAPSGAYCLA
ncbi:MAG: hypothetical protein DRP99_03335, partial [Candidatus Latescibacterota bacterium]